MLIIKIQNDGTGTPEIGNYGISPDAFTRIDRFITRYNHAVSAGKVSVDVKPVR